MELNELIQIANQFKLKGSVVSIEPLISGHINTTFVLKTTESSYIFQQINDEIFQDVEALMQNIKLVTNHVKSKGVSTLELAFTKNGDSFYQSNSGSFWRIFHFIPNTKVISTLENKSQATAMGRAFGEFHAALNDLEVEKVSEILPGFHNASKRIDDFKESVRNNLSNRGSSVSGEIELLMSLEQEMNSYYKNEIIGKLPLRIIHQDTKLSNILFHTTSDELTVIDLDTMMPGFLCFDFGDAIRGGMSMAAEDEADLAKVDVNLGYFEAFANAYAKETKHIIKKQEIESLVLGGILITYVQALRFLGDYLNGDIYYHTTYESHNLTRAKNQIVLLKKLQEYYDEMNDLVLKAYSIK